MRSVLKSLYLKAFPLFERLGVHVTPVHHTQPIPDTRRLDAEIWRRTSAMVGIDMREADQVRLVEDFARRFRAEYDALPRAKLSGPPRFYLDNPFFGSVDAEMLYSMIRATKPRRIFEIGAGFSTLLAAQAVERNVADGAPCRLESYDPFPAAYLRNGIAGLEAIEATAAQDIPLSVFEALDAGDILFLDSTHVIRVGGDVVYEVLEVLPRLRPGVLVHLHDIFLPAEYPRDWIMEQRLFWNEQYLLQAFLSFNAAYEVVWGAGFMHLHHPRELAAAFASYDPAVTRPGSFWVRRVAP